MLSTFVAVVTVVGAVASSSTGPNWTPDYGAALAETRAEHRPLVVVIDDPACSEHSLSAELLSPAGEAAELLASYELCHVDGSTEYGQEVARRFGATTFPYIAIIDRQGKHILHQHSGQVDQQSWAAKLVGYRAGLLPQRVVVAKPVITESYEPANYVGGVSQSIGYPMPSNGASPQPYCAKCQRGY